MPLFMVRFGYKPEVWARLVQQPENREQLVGDAMAESGAKLLGLWYAFGECDGYALLDAPSNEVAAGLSIAITATGAFRSFETTPLMTQEEAFGALRVAAESRYHAPAAPVPA